MQPKYKLESITKDKLLSRVGGWSNNAIYGESYDENSSWKSPRVQSIHSAIKHIEIVAHSTDADHQFHSMSITDSI
jgi:hypothetical protein